MAHVSVKYCRRNCDCNCAFTTSDLPCVAGPQERAGAKCLRVTSLAGASSPLAPEVQQRMTTSDNNDMNAARDANTG